MQNKSKQYDFYHGTEEKREMHKLSRMQYFKSQRFVMADSWKMGEILTVGWEITIFPRFKSNDVYVQ